MMPVHRPNADRIHEVAMDLGLNLSDAQLAVFTDQLDGVLAAYDLVHAEPDYLPEVTYPRTPGYRPEGEENLFGAWHRKVLIKGAPTGPLAGKRVVIKDNVCVAGVPMANGSSTFEGYVPEIDATVVTRLLDAGATIVGKSACECFCLSAGSHTNMAGLVHNPRQMGRSTGGSSSGSGALLAAGEVDLAIGCDQGGSIRIPAAFCGVYGMKPTFGLVPYTGAMPIDLTIDHIGPMSNSVADNAAMLQAIAGPDGLDPRQSALSVPADYRADLAKGIEGLRIGVVKEGFGHANSEKAVDEAVRAAADRFGRLGASVEELSLPMHSLASAIWIPIAAEGGIQMGMKGNSHGFNWRGLYVTSMIDRHAGWQDRADELSDSLKLFLLLGEYSVQHFGGRFYAKAQNLARKARAAYDAVFAHYDLLVMPTVPMLATPLPGEAATLEERLLRSTESAANTTPLNVTGHPAMSIPCAMRSDLPVGMQIIGRHFDEATIYRCAYAFEQSIDWKKI